MSQADLSISVPDVPDSQFALFSYYDTFGDNFANTGTNLISRPGKYLLQGPANRSHPTGAFARNGSNSDYVADIFSPTSYGILLIRWLVNATNLDALHGYQDQTMLQPVNQSKTGNTPSLVSLGTNRMNGGKPAEQVLQLLSKYAPYNPPQSPATAMQVNAQLKAAGISNGTYTQPQGVDLEAANSSAKASAAASAYSPNNIVNLNNGWSIPSKDVGGNFNNGTNFDFRMYVASTAFLMIQEPSAVYPTWRNNSDANSTSSGSPPTLDRNEAFIYTFSRKPPLMKTGFWSITAYGADNFLIDNDLNRFEIGDRSNATYPDGKPVYGPNATSEDGPFQVLVQAADNPPPQNWTSNWLPGPPGGGSASILLRFFGAQQSLLNGDYKYPMVTRRAAITGNGNGTMSGGSSSGSGSGSGSTAGGSSTPSSSMSSAASPTSSASSAEKMAGVRDASLLALLAGSIALIL